MNNKKASVIFAENKQWGKKTKQNKKTKNNRVATENAENSYQMLIKNTCIGINKGKDFQLRSYAGSQAVIHKNIYRESQFSFDVSKVTELVRAQYAVINQYIH